MQSPYASVASTLIDNGYSAIPIMPGTKRPGVYQFNNWYGTSEWNRFCDRLPTDIEIPIWEKWPDAGVCVAIDKTLKVVDIDTDDAAMMAAVLAILPDSPVKKRGAKGFSAFYRGSNAVVSTPFSIKVQNQTKPIRIVDLLAHGRQTVLPPTIHPDSGRPYEWTTTDTLIDTDISSLPILPDNIADLLSTALEPFGYISTEEHKAIARGDGDTIWREINDTALKNLSVWVPALRIPGTKESGKGYRAIADWRGGENTNLSFHPEGIKDWVDMKSYSPIDIVMIATGSDFYTATKWLCEQLGIEQQASDGFDIAAFVARSQAKPEKPSSTLIVPQMEPQAVVPTIIEAPAPIAAPRGHVNPFDFETHDGILGDISGWIHDTARVPVPEFSTIASIAFLSAFFGRRYVTPTGAGLNMYLIGIAGAGFGKDHPRRAIEEIGHSAQFHWLIGPNEVTSDSAIEKILRKRPCFVMPWDEIGVMLQGVSGRQSQSWTRSIRKALLELYSRSTGIWTGKEHADSKSDSSGEPIFCPTVSLLGMSTPTEFYAGITEQNLSDGMVARMTVISVNERPERKDSRPLLIVPQSIIDKMRAAYSAKQKSGNLSGASERDPKRKPVLYPAEWGEGANNRWKRIEQWQLDQIDENPEQQGVVGRAAEQTVKLATIRAISRDPAKPVVSLDDVEWGYAIVQRSLDAIDEGVQKHMAGSEFETTHKRILEVIKESGEDGIARSVLLRKRGISKVQPREVEAAIRWLQDTAQVESRMMTPKGGRPGVKLFATT